MWHGTAADCFASAPLPIVNPLRLPSPRRWAHTSDGMSRAGWRMTASATAAMHAGTTIRTPSIARV